MAAENIIRSLLPDVGVFATSLVSLCFCAIVAAQHGKKKDEGQEEREREEEGEKEGERTRGRVSGSVSPDEELANLSSGVTLHPPFPRNVQCYLRLPNMFVYFFEAAIFFLLGLSGELRMHCTYMYIIRLSRTHLREFSQPEVFTVMAAFINFVLGHSTCVHVFHAVGSQSTLGLLHTCICIYMYMQGF